MPKSHPILIIKAEDSKVVLIIILCRQDMFRYVTLWSFNIAMENGPFTDYFPIKASIYKGFSIAMLNNQRVSVSWPFPWWTCNRSHGAAFGLGFLPHFAHGVLQPGHGVSPLRVSPKRKNNNLIGIRKWLMYVHVIWWCLVNGYSDMVDIGWYKEWNSSFSKQMWSQRSKKRSVRLLQLRVTLDVPGLNQRIGACGLEHFL